MDHDGGRRFAERDRRRNRDRYHDGTTFHTDRPGGEVYRPGAANRARSRTPPRAGTYRRRSRSPRDARDRYRDRDRDSRDDYRGKERSRERPRSPPRRGSSPRREENNYRPTRTLARDARYARSPRRERERSPIKRSRETSPADRRAARSPPPKRERLASPRSRYRSTSLRRSPPPSRDRHRHEENNYRPRSGSPRGNNTPSSNRYARRSPSPRKISAPESGTTSRRSSPPVHPSRLRQIPENRKSYDDRSSYASPSRERERPLPVVNGAPPTGPRNGSRIPPSGPAGSRNFSSPVITAPTGPTGVAPSRPFGPNSMFSAPSRPRGSFGGGSRGGQGGYQRELPLPRKISEYHTGTRTLFAGSPPTGPRGSGGAPPSGPARYRPSAAAGSSATAVLPRSQRFLNDLPSLVPGGQPRPAKLPSNGDKSKKLDQEAERLRRHIEDAEIDKRARLREWERLQGEADSAKLGTELAAERLRQLEMEELKQ